MRETPIYCDKLYVVVVHTPTTWSNPLQIQSSLFKVIDYEIGEGAYTRFE
jgi:hypothetical protein